MNQVVTQQTKAIIASRNVKMPVEYEAAVKALAACIDIDEAKHWADKADALAAWAKIYRSKDAERKARQLKLHAFRRMGQLAADLRPPTLRKNAGLKGRGMAPGSISLLKENGLSANLAAAASRLGTLPQPRFDAMVASPCPPSPTVVTKIVARGGTDAYAAVMMNAKGPGLVAMRSWMRRHNAGDLARALKVDEMVRVREVVREISDWLDEFDRCLPK